MVDRPLLIRPVVPGGTAAVDELLTALDDALRGSGPALAPRSPGTSSASGADPEPGPAENGSVPGDVALVVRTSGSTGRPRDVMLDTTALLASARATHDRLGGPGRWVLALPLAHIAGLQVLIRSLVAEREPVVVPPAGGFDPVALADSVARASGEAPLYTSLVPTQLHRIVGAAAGGSLPGPLTPLRRLSAILLGGAAAPAALLDRARELDLPVVTTYGMTETSGGCVYDGVPLDGVQVDTGADGAVLLAGPVLARGYLGRPDLDAQVFVERHGQRWLRTRDVGDLTGGVLRVLGRSDDVVVTGGVKVPPAAVEEVLADVPGVGQVCVVGIPDVEWGQAVTAVVVPARAASRSGPVQAPALETLRDVVTRTLGAAAAPRHLVLLDTLPERGPGKVDRAEVTRLATAEVAGRAAPQ